MDSSCQTHAQRRSNLIEGLVYCLDCNQPLPKLYPDRVGYWHKNMGPPEYYVNCCGGRGTSYDEDGREIYCQCEAGRLRKEIE